MKDKYWIHLFLCIILSFSSCDEESNLVIPSEPDHELLEDSYVYMSTVPGTCGMELNTDFYEHSWHICIHAPDTNSVGVYFRIEPYDFGPEDSVLIAPAAGVSFDGDLLTGMTLSWEVQSFDHESVLSMHFTDKPPSQNEWYGLIAEFHDSELFLEGGESVYLENVGVAYIYCGSYGGATYFRHPDSFMVHSGDEVILTFEGIGTSPGPYAAYGLHADDGLGWTGQVLPESIPTTCVFCPWMWIDFELQVVVPPTTLPGTRNVVSILDFNEEPLTSFELIVE